MPHPDIKFVDDARVEDMHPVSGPAVIGVEVVRKNSPPICITAGPPGGAKSFIVPGPPLVFPVQAVVICRLEVKTKEIAVFRYVYALLVNVIVGVTGRRATKRRIRKWKDVEQREAARIPAVPGNDVV